MTPEQEKDLRDAADAASSKGFRVVPIGTSDPGLPWALLLVPTLADCDLYASRARTSPVTASIDVFQRCLVGYPRESDPMALVQAKPFVALRVVQALLGSLGLTVGAEKKSLIPN